MHMDNRKLIAAALLGAALAVSAGCTSSPTRESAGEYIDDTALTTRVKALLGIPLFILIQVLP